MTAEQLLELVDGLEANGLLGQYSHLLTGYIGSEALLQAVVQVATRLAAHNPDLIYVCDPVSGVFGAVLGGARAARPSDSALGGPSAHRSWATTAGCT